MKRILFSYILRETVSSFLTSLLVLTSILLLGKIAPMTELLLKKGVSVWDLLQIIVFVLPHLLLFAFPMATLLGTLLGYTRMAKDNELLAMKACGIGFYQLLPAALVLSGGMYLATLFTAVYAQPWGNHASKVLLFRVMQLRADLSLREGEFSDALKGLVIYVKDVKKDGKLEGIYIRDDRDGKTGNTVVAREGWVFSQPKRLVLVFCLKDGSIHRIAQDWNSAQTIEFEKYILTLDAQTAGTSELLKKEKREMSISEIRERIRGGPAGCTDYNSLVMELHRKLALPVACLILGIAGAALGAQSTFAGSSFGVSVGLVVFLVYYLVLALAKGLGETGFLHPAVSMWLPNGVFVVICTYLAVKVHREEPIWFMEILQRLSDFLERTRKR
ncbi:MAG: LPS export ABC transporter permease LptF [Pseudomonadota bacterium]